MVGGEESCRPVWLSWSKFNGTQTQAKAVVDKTHKKRMAYANELVRTGKMYLYIGKIRPTMTAVERSSAETSFCFMFSALLLRCTVSENKNEILTASPLSRVDSVDGTVPRLAVVRITS